MALDTQLELTNLRKTLWPMSDETSCEAVLQTHPWYCVRTKSKFERAVANSLLHKGYQPYVPYYREGRRTTERGIETKLPLFPGYVFCRFDVNRRLPILITPGVVCLVGVGKEPLAVPDSEVAAVEALENSGCAVRSCGYLRAGQRVRIERGPLAGVEGVFLKSRRSEWRLVVSVNLLQRSVAVEVDRDWVTS